MSHSVGHMCMGHSVWVNPWVTQLLSHVSPILTKIRVLCDKRFTHISLFCFESEEKEAREIQHTQLWTVPIKFLSIFFLLIRDRSGVRAPIIETGAMKFPMEYSISCWLNHEFPCQPWCRHYQPTVKVLISLNKYVIHYLSHYVPWDGSFGSL